MSICLSPGWTSLKPRSNEHWQIQYHQNSPSCCIWFPTLTLDVQDCLQRFPCSSKVSLTQKSASNFHSSLCQVELLPAQILQQDWRCVVNRLLWNFPLVSNPQILFSVRLLGRPTTYLQGWSDEKDSPWCLQNKLDYPCELKSPPHAWPLGRHKTVDSVVVSRGGNTWTLSEKMGCKVSLPFVSQSSRPSSVPAWPTNSIELTLSWEANSHSPSQDISFFCETRRLITVSIEDHPWSVWRVWCIQSTFPHHIYLNT